MSTSSRVLDYWGDCIVISQYRICIEELFILRKVFFKDALKFVMAALGLAILLGLNHLPWDQLKYQLILIYTCISVH